MQLQEELIEEDDLRKPRGDKPPNSYIVMSDNSLVQRDNELQHASDMSGDSNNSSPIRVDVSDHAHLLSMGKVQGKSLILGTLFDFLSESLVKYVAMKSCNIYRCSVLFSKILNIFQILCYDTFLLRSFYLRNFFLCQTVKLIQFVLSFTCIYLSIKYPVFFQI